MSYHCIFPDSTEFPIPIYPVLGLLLCSALYAALFQFTLNKIIENLFALSSVFGHVERTIIYLFIINFPAIALTISCLAYNHSLIGFYINIDIDIFQTLLLSAYICYVEQSRQTPLNGFLFIRDLLMVIGFLSGLLKLYLDGKPDIAYGFVLLSFYLIYYISQLFEEKLEDIILRILGIKSNNDFNSAYLLTHAWKQADFLGLKQRIDQNKQRVKHDIQQFKQILGNTVDNHDQRLILQNFSKLFLPYLTANKIKQQQVLKEYDRIFIEESEQVEQRVQIHTPSVNDENRDMDIVFDEFDKSDIQILNRNTLTDDFIVQDDDELMREQSNLETALKYAFYPIYLMSLVEGRPRYFLDYLSFVLLLGCMWVIGNSSVYFAEQTTNNCYLFISIAVSLLLTIPPSRYYFKISRQKDFDFINIFLQGAILKSTIFAIAITIIAFIDTPFTFYAGLPLMISVALGIAVYLVYGILMTAQKFATLKSNFKYINGILIFMYFLRLTAQLVLNLAVNKQ